MKSPSEILNQLLLDNDKVADAEAGDTAADWSAFIGFLPETPDNVVALYDTMGLPDGRIMRTGERIEHPGIQLTVRSADYSSGYAKINGIALFLDAQKEVSIELESDEVYVLQNVKRVGTLNYIGVETQGSKRRYLFTMNMILTLQQKIIVPPPPGPDWTDMIKTITFPLAEQTSDEDGNTIIPAQQFMESWEHNLGKLPDHLECYLLCTRDDVIFEGESNEARSGVLAGQMWKVGQGFGNGLGAPGSDFAQFFVYADAAKIYFNSTPDIRGASTAFVLNDGTPVNLESFNNFSLVIKYA